MDRYTREVFDKIMAERHNQIMKWGDPEHTPFEYLAILVEEVGEAGQAALHDKYGGDHAGTLKKELIHVAAVAVQWLEHLEKAGGE